ncbi:unnamed protein product [Musa acuminata var. zebrina]
MRRSSTAAWPTTPGIISLRSLRRRSARSSQIQHLQAQQSIFCVTSELVQTCRSLVLAQPGASSSAP